MLFSGCVPPEEPAPILSSNSASEYGYYCLCESESVVLRFSAMRPYRPDSSVWVQNGAPELTVSDTGTYAYVRYLPADTTIISGNDTFLRAPDTLRGSVRVIHPSQLSPDDIGIPNAFSPNRDGLNEELEINVPCARALRVRLMQASPPFAQIIEKAESSNRIEVADWDMRNRVPLPGGQYRLHLEAWFGNCREKLIIEREVYVVR